jgi:hypothetical protein
MWLLFGKVYERLSDSEAWSQYLIRDVELEGLPLTDYAAVRVDDGRVMFAA